MKKSDIRARYESRTAFLSAELLRERGKSRWFIISEITLFALAAASAVAFIAGSIAVYPFIFTFNPLIALFFVVKCLDRESSKKMESLEATLGVYRDNISCLDGQFSGFDSGERYIDHRHPFTFDMDIFGNDSLYQRMCRCVTTGGADSLAHTLANMEPASDADSNGAARIVERRKAIAELAGMEEWRTEFLAVAQKGRVDTGKIREAVSRARQAGIPAKAASRSALWLVCGSILVFAVLLLLSVFGNLSADLVCIWAVAQLGASIGLSAKAIKMITKAAGRINDTMKPYIRLIQLVGEADVKEPENRRLFSLLSDGGALDSLRELKGVLDALDRRANVLGLVIFNALGWSDFFLVRRYLRWQERNFSSLGSWLDAVSLIDAMVSMATFRYNEPDAVDPEIIGSEEIVYEAKNLCHPFLGAKAVGNDFTVSDRCFYIITGANMAGKSTFLRSVGINYVLAMCGMPVFADSMRVSVFSLFSSMRTSDDLSHGVSYFNAELLRLKLLLDSVKRNRRTLIILDEILKGTNSLDKLNGSRMFLRAVAGLPVSGIVATHDLKLSKMTEEFPGRFFNFCFEIELTDSISYSYKITPGVARNQNATFLLEGILKG